MLESDLKKLNSLDKDCFAASAMYREKINEVEQKVVEKIIKEGVLAGKKFYPDVENRKLVYQGYRDSIRYSTFNYGETDSLENCHFRQQTVFQSYYFNG
jgi:hypothetical protein